MTREAVDGIIPNEALVIRTCSIAAISELATGVDREEKGLRWGGGLSQPRAVCIDSEGILREGAPGVSHRVLAMLFTHEQQQGLVMGVVWDRRVERNGKIQGSRAIFVKDGACPMPTSIVQRIRSLDPTTAFVLQSEGI